MNAKKCKGIRKVAKILHPETLETNYIIERNPNNPFQFKPFRLGPCFKQTYKMLKYQEARR